MAKMDKIFNITSSFKTKTDEKGVSIIGLASASSSDRAGDIIPSSAWNLSGGLENFKKNPIILFNHNYDMPIGKAVGVEATELGLMMEAYISDSAPNGIQELIKDGVLGAFSVGFRIKDADYIEETGGLLIKDAELFEVSVVSVPCNQDATFSIAKAFDSNAEYEDFRKTFINRVDLAGHNLAKDEANASKVASDTPDGDKTHLENKMTEEELQAFAKKVAEETAAKMAIKQAEQKAADKLAAEKQAAEEAALITEKANQEESIQSTIKFGIESGTEALLKDVEAKLLEKDAKIDEVVKSFAANLAEKNDEITKMRESKRVFSDNTKSNSGLSEFGKEFMHAHMLGVMTDKGFNTDYARSVYEKAGIDYTGVNAAPDIAQEVSTQIEKEIMLYLRLASVFREIPVNSQSTVLPIQPDVNPATWQALGAPTGNLDNPRNNTANTFKPEQVILTAQRLISQTYMDNHVDEEVLINLMPMLVDSVARAHARAVDIAILNGNGAGITGLTGFATDSADTLSIGGAAALTALTLMSARKQMGKYGLDPTDLAYVVSQARYYELIADPEFADINEIGTLATKLTGTVGAVYGTPVIISDNFIAEATGENVAYAVNLRNYVIPRLRGVTVEQDYEVANQRRVVVATQSLGFNELVVDDVLNQSCVAVPLVA